MSASDLNVVIAGEHSDDDVQSVSVSLPAGLI